jgi:hypothetical protein
MFLALSSTFSTHLGPFCSYCSQFDPILFSVVAFLDSVTILKRANSLEYVQSYFFKLKYLFFSYISFIFKHLSRIESKLDKTSTNIFFLYIDPALRCAALGNFSWVQLYSLSISWNYRWMSPHSPSWKDLFFPFASARVWTYSLILDRQVLYYLSHTPVLFWFGCFLNRLS